MYNAFIAFIAILILGGVIFWTVWWQQGANLSWRFTKWYFLVFLAAAIIVGIATYAGAIQF